MKQVKEERLAIILNLTREGGIEPVQISCRADYEVTAEGLTEHRAYSYQLSDSEEKTVKAFAAAILAQIKQLEES